MDDEDYKTESDWVRDQRSSGCMRHSSSNESEYLDSISTHHLHGPIPSKPSVGTDDGPHEDHRNFGYLDPAETMDFLVSIRCSQPPIPSACRVLYMELERRTRPKKTMTRENESFGHFFRLLEEPTECFSPWTGIENGKIIWDGDGSVCQLYVLKETAKTRGFRPYWICPRIPWPLCRP